jgi:hypothetical protein
LDPVDDNSFRDDARQMGGLVLIAAPPAVADGTVAQMRRAATG